MSLDQEPKIIAALPPEHDKTPGIFEEILKKFGKKTVAITAGAGVVVAGVTAGVVSALGPRGTESTVPGVSGTPAASAPETPGVSTTPTPEATTTTSPTTEASETQTATATPEASTSEKEAIEAALQFAEAPLAERQAEFMAMATKAMNATDPEDPFMNAFSDTAGATGAVLASYNPAYHPGEADDTAVQIYGQTQFALQLAHNIEQPDKPGKLDVPAALKVLAGAFYDPIHARLYPTVSGQRNKDYGLLNRGDIGQRSGVGTTTNLEFDTESERDFPTIIDEAGKELPVRIVQFDVNNEGDLIRDIVVLKDGQWLLVDGAISESSWNKVASNWKTLLQS